MNEQGFRVNLSDPNGSGSISMEFDPLKSSLRLSPDKAYLLIDAVPSSETEGLRQLLDLSSLSSLTVCRVEEKYCHLVELSKDLDTRTIADTLSDKGFPSARITPVGTDFEICVSVYGVCCKACEDKVLDVLRHTLPINTFEVAMGHDEIILTLPSSSTSSTDFLADLHLTQMHKVITHLGYSCHLRDPPSISCPSNSNSSSEALFFLAGHYHSCTDVKCYFTLFKRLCHFRRELYRK
ncbi:unnamed protein product [Hydatigera taeniaeformis]|uniref:Uncharacterized protein n=1 Tax=Hydatigena taeniaeformis TaxID=6205 RepID=A0A3P7HPL4_HYDTA|nr:unnamed protein product [Hydatigera taeniaeformis]